MRLNYEPCKCAECQMSHPLLHWVANTPVRPALSGSCAILYLAQMRPSVLGSDEPCKYAEWQMRHSLLHWMANAPICTWLNYEPYKCAEWQMCHSLLHWVAHAPLSIWLVYEGLEIECAQNAPRTGLIEPNGACAYDDEIWGGYD